MLKLSCDFIDIFIAAIDIPAPAADAGKHWFVMLLPFLRRTFFLYLS